MCLVDESDGPVITIGADERPRAKRQHRCSECRRTIDPGERYLRERYVADGVFRVHKTCAHCEVARAWLQDECGGWLYGGVEEDIRQHCEDGSGYSMSLYRIAVGMDWRWHTPRGRLLPIPRMPRTGHEIAAQRGEEQSNG